MAHSRFTAIPISWLDGQGREDLDGGGKHLLGKVRVPLRHPQVGVPQELLHGADVHPAHREPRGEIVPQVMEPEAPEARTLGHPPEGRGDAPAVPLIGEERGGGIGGPIQRPEEEAERPVAGCVAARDKGERAPRR